MKTFLIWDGSRCQTGGVSKQTISPLPTEELLIQLSLIRLHMRVCAHVLSNVHTRKNPLLSVVA